MNPQNENDIMAGFIKDQKGYNPSMDDLSAYDKPFTPPDNLQFQMADDNGAPQGPTQPLPQQPQEPYLGYEEPQRPMMPYDHQDELLFPGGPAKSELESWKKQYEAQGLDIWIVDDLPVDQVFIYRDMNRYEYKAIQATPNTDALMREELICEQCVLFPYEYNYGAMANGKAGIASVLAQHIMATSGFTKASMPRRL